MTIVLNRRQFTLAEYHQMIATGVLPAGDRVELIDGDVLEMAAIGSKHAAQVNRLNRIFSAFVGDDLLLSIQNPLELGPRSEPQPDLVLLRWRADYYASSHPQPEDVYLVIEVAESTVDFDRNVKAVLYAQSGIGEYWLINLVTDAIEVYRQPTPDGYQTSTTQQRGSTITLAARSEITVTVDQLLGSRG
jgi:Uma2 family endonuclease